MPQFPSIRFKFMPTPSGKLHAGHAWLLFLMKYLCGKAQAEGISSDIVLVVDDLTAQNQGLTQETIDANRQAIIEESKWLGIEYGDVINNSDAFYKCKEGGKAIYWRHMAQAAPNCLVDPRLNGVFLGDEYYRKNVLIDMAMGVTHIIRGEDQLAKYAIYHAYYGLWNLNAPCLVYLPFVQTDNGGKISGANQPYTVAGLKEFITPKLLFSLLVDGCIKKPEEQNEASGLDEILGENWKWVLPVENSQALLTGFLNTLQPTPKLALPAAIAEGQK